MSVLCEAISVVVRNEALDARYPGGRAAFAEQSPNGTFCADRHLSRIGFLGPADVHRFVESLAQHGLRFLEQGQAVDLAVIDQFNGPTAEAPWLAWEQHPDGYTHAWLAGTRPGVLEAPARWDAEASRTMTRVVPGTDEWEEMLRQLPEGVGTGVHEVAFGPHGERRWTSEALEREPAAALWAQHAWALARQGERPRALGAFKRALELEPEDAELWHGLGVTLGQVREYEEAARAFERCLGLDAGHPVARRHLALARLWGGDADAALLTILEHVGREADDAEGWVTAGQVYEALGRQRDALRAYQQAAVHDPGEPDHWYSQGVMHHQLGETMEALEAYREALERNPRHARALVNRGGLLSDSGRLDEARPLLDRAVEEAPDDAFAWWHRASLLVRVGEVAAAIEAFGMVERLGAGDADLADLVQEARVRRGALATP